MADLTQIWDMPDDSKSTISWGTTLTGRNTARSTGTSLSLGGGVHRAAQEARRRERRTAKLQLIKQQTRNVYSSSAKDFRPSNIGPDQFPSRGATRGGGEGSVSTRNVTDSLIDLSQSTGARVKARRKKAGIVRTPLMRAAAKGDVEEVKAAIEARVDLFEEDHKGRTALDWARVSRIPECRECARLLQQGMRHFVEARALQNKLVLQQEKLEEAVHINIRCQAELQRAVRANDMDEMLRIARSFGLTREDVVANTDALEQFMAQLPTFEEILQSMAEADVPEDLRLPDCTVPPGSDILSPRSSEASWAGAGGGAGAGGRSGARRARFADEEAAKKEHQEAQASTLAMGGEVGEAWSDTRAPTVLNYKLGSDGLPMGSPSPAHNPKHSRVSLPIPIGINKFGAHVFALDVETRDGWTALTRAAVADDVPALKDFIRLGAQIDLETRLRHTALTWAATCGHVPIARELVIAGADPNRITSQGKTPLICAASRGNAEMVVFLLESMMVRTLAPAARIAMEGDDGLDPDTFAPPAQDHTGQVSAPSLLDYNVECFREILHWRDNSGKNAFDWAAEAGSASDNLVLDALMGAETRLAERKQHIRNAFEANVKRPCKRLCGFWGPRQRLYVHERYECPEDMAKCEWQCGMQVLRKNMPEHQRHECPKRLIPCDFESMGCDVVLNVPKMAIHLKHQCRFKPTDCPRDCGRVLRGDDVDSHLAERCPFRFITCACGVSIEVAYHYKHVQTVCTRRLVPCDGTDWRLWEAEHNPPLPRSLKDKVVKDAPDGQGVIILAVGFESNEPVQDEYDDTFAVGEEGVDPQNDPATAKEYREVRMQLVRPPSRLPTPVLERLGGRPGKVVGCGAVLPFDSMLVHLSHTCPARFIKCSYCDLMVAPADRRHIHETQFCPRRPIACKWSCGQDIPAEELDHHQNDVCPLRQVPCPQGCPEPVVWRELEWHVRRSLDGVCARRPVPCPYDVVGKTVRFRKIVIDASARHTLDEADVEYKVEEVLFIDQDADAARRGSTASKSEAGTARSGDRGSETGGEEVAAPSDGALVGAHDDVPTVASTAANPQDDTRASTPPRVPPMSPLAPDTASAARSTARSGGGSQAAASQHGGSVHTPGTATHATPPHVPSRPLQVHVPVAEDVDEYHVSPLPPRGFRPESAWKFGVIRHFNAATYMHTISVPGEGAITVNLFDRWQVEFTKAADREWHCHDVTFPTLQDHVNNDCYRRRVKCAQCGAFYPGGQEDIHLRDRCDMRLIPCRLTGDNRDSRRGGCEAVVPARHIHDHETLECRFRPVACTCGEDVAAYRMADHRRNDCALRFVICPNACTEKVQARALEDHLANHCGRREVECELGCNTVHWAADLASHQRDECPFRMVVCPNKCGQEMLARHLQPHMRNKCSHRMAKCPNKCLDRVLAHTMDEHLRLHCEMRRVTCTLGCQREMYEHQRAAHELLECGCRMQACKHGCNKMFQMVRVRNHEENECHRRPKPCPRECGTILWAADIPDHLEWCMRQFACCSAVGDNFRHEIEQIYERPEAIKSAMVLQERMGKDPSYTVEDFMRDQDVEYFDPEVQAALAKLDAKSARSLNVATPHWAPTLARRLQMQRLRAIKEQGEPMPKYKDVLDRMEEMYIKIKRHEAEDDHRNLDSEETKQVLAFLDHRADEKARERAWKVKNITGSMDTRKPGCFMELHEWIVVPEILNEEVLATRDAGDATAAGEEEHKGGTDSENKGQEADGGGASTRRRGAVSGPPTPAPARHMEPDAAMYKTGRSLGAKSTGTMVVAPPPTASVVTSRTNDRRFSQKGNLKKLRQGGGIMKFCEKHGDNPLIQAAKTGDLKRLGAILPLLTTQSIDAENKSGHNALTAACRFGQFDAVEMLLNVGADANLETTRGSSPLLEACMFKHMKIIRLLLKRNAVIAKKNRYGLSVLDMARRLDLGEVRDYVERKNKIYEAQRAMFIAISTGDNDGLRRMLHGSEKHREDHVRTLKAEIAEGQRMDKELTEEIANHKDIIAEQTALEVELRATLRQVEAETGQRVVDGGLEPGTPLYRAYIAHHLAENQVRLHTDKLAKAEKELVLQKQGIVANKRRLEVAIIVNKTSDCGHNALCWAVANHEYKAVQILLQNGATADYDDETRWQSARLIQECWKRFKWAVGPQRKKYKSIIERWLHDTVQLKALKRIVMERRAIRRGSRVPVCEAVFNGCADLIPLLITKAAKGSLYQTTFVAPVGPIGCALAAVKRRRRGSILNFEAMTDAMNILACARFAMVRRGCREVVAGEGWRSEQDGKQGRMLHWATGKQSDLDFDAANKASLIRTTRVARITAKEDEENRKLMHEHLKLCKWPEILRLLEDGVTVEAETPDGHTAVTIAAEREAYIDISVMKEMYGMGFQVASMGVTDLAQEDWDGLTFQPPTEVVSESVLARRGVDNYAREHAARDPLVNMTAVGTKRPESGRREGGPLKPGEPLVGADGSQTGRTGGMTSRTLTARATARSRRPITAAERALAAIEDAGAGAEETKAVVVHRTRLMPTVDNKVIAKTKDHPDIIVDNEFGRSTNEIGSTLVRPHREHKMPSQVLVLAVMFDRRHHRPNPNRETSAGHTPLTRAAEYGRMHAIQALIERGADVNYQTADGTTALMRAARKGKLDVVRMLAERGADLELKDKSGRDAYHWASDWRELQAFIAAYRAKNLGIARPVVGAPRTLFRCSHGCPAALPRLQLIEHEANSCPKRVVPCPLLCGIQGLWAEELGTHQRDSCPRRVVACPKNCGTEMQWVFLRSHLANKCPFRIAACRFACGVRREFMKLAEHEVHSCPKRPTGCPVGCDAQVPLDEHDSHSQVCPKRWVRCRHGCMLEMFLEQRPKHESTLCSHRPVECKWGCGEDGPWYQVQAHELNDCDQRVMPCKNGCGEEVAKVDEEEHFAKLCPHRFLYCPAGCRVRISLQFKAAHDRVCHHRQVTCTLGCGASMRFADLKHHETRDCPNRKSPCGMGCGEFISVPLMAQHKATSCTKRFVQCQHDLCEKIVQFDQLDNHMRNQCRKRKMYCRLGCGNTFVAQFEATHNKSCPCLFVTCKHKGCGEMMPQKHIKFHEDSCERNLEKITFATDMTALMASATKSRGRHKR